MADLAPAGDYRGSYREDMTIFPTRNSRIAVLLGRPALRRAAAARALRARHPDQYRHLGIAALGLNILVGFTGQISIGHAAFFGFGAFASAWLHERCTSRWRSASRSPAS